MKNEENYDDLIDWFSLTFQEKLSEVHGMVLFPERRNKNKVDFLTMIIQRLIDKTDKMTDEEIVKFFE